ncbi:hypothetical protein F4778DRAFT_220301 [Xylariomycetidae sp. FL2044]|nr:hypothetical protein F4778DRAFT_220301 [Xylariomycetidae sp. FL2044]
MIGITAGQRAPAYRPPWLLRSLSLSLSLSLVRRSKYIPIEARCTGPQPGPAYCIVPKDLHVLLTPSLKQMVLRERTIGKAFITHVGRFADHRRPCVKTRRAQCSAGRHLWGDVEQAFCPVELPGRLCIKSDDCTKHLLQQSTWLAQPTSEWQRGRPMRMNECWEKSHPANTTQHITHTYTHIHTHINTCTQKYLVHSSLHLVIGTL